MTLWGGPCVRCGHPSVQHGVTFCMVQAGSSRKRPCDCPGYRIAEGDNLGSPDGTDRGTSTTRDVDPGNAQDARRVCPACNGTGYGSDVVTGRTDLCPCCWGSRTLRALTDAGDDATGTGEAS